MTFHRSVNTEKYIEFLKELRKKHGKGRFTLYMDSLSVHKSIGAKDMYDKLDIDTILAPVYSSEYNPIEMMFSKLKGIVKRIRLQDMLKQKKKVFKDTLPQAA